LGFSFVVLLSVSILVLVLVSAPVAGWLADTGGGNDTGAEIKTNTRTDEAKNKTKTETQT